MLYLNKNYLIELPNSLGDLTELKTLHLNNNNLTALPNSLGNLSRLEKIYLFGNNLTDAVLQMFADLDVHIFLSNESTYIDSQRYWGTRTEASAEETPPPDVLQ